MVNVKLPSSYAELGITHITWTIVNGEPAWSSCVDAQGKKIQYTFDEQGNATPHYV